MLVRWKTKLVGAKPKVHSFLEDARGDHKQERVWKKCGCKNKSVNTKMFCIITFAWGIQWIVSKTKTIKYEFMKSTKFLYHGLMKKYLS